MDFEKLIADSKEKDMITLQEEISQIMSNKRYKTDAFTSYTFNDLYRARNHNNLLGNVNEGKLSEFKNEQEFWNVPEKDAKQGRCNLEGESLFYCSSEFITSVLEVKPKVGHFVTVSIFKNFPHYKKPEFIMIPIGKTFLKKIPALDLLFEKVELNKDQIEIEEFLNKLFHQNIINKEEEYKYKLSIAIAKNFMINGTNVNNEIIKSHGLIYPSIIRNQKSYCFVLKPWIVHHQFFIDYILTLEVLEKRCDYIKIKLVRCGKPKFQKLYLNDELFDINWEKPLKENIEIFEF